MKNRLFQQFVVRGLWFLAVLLFALTAFLISWAQWEPMPFVINDHQAGASVLVRSPQTRVTFPDECYVVSWQVSGIDAIKLNDHFTVGEGSETICADAATFEVKFRNGDVQNYAILRHTVSERAYIFQLVLAGSLFVAVALYLDGRHKRIALYPVVRDWLAAITPPAHRRPHNIPLWPLVALILAGTALRLHYIGLPIRADEAYTFSTYSSRALGEALSSYGVFNNHPLHTVAQHLAYRLWGDDVIALRLPVFFAGVLLIAMTFRAYNSLYKNGGGLIAAAAVACSVPLVEFSVNARGYSFTFVIFLLEIILATRLIKTTRFRPWLVMSLLIPAGFYTMPTMVYPTIAVAVWLGVLILTESHPQRKRQLLRNYILTFALGGFITAALYLPFLPDLSGTGHQQTDLSPLEIVSLDRHVKRLPQHVAEVWGAWTRATPPLMVAVMALGALLAFGLHSRLAKHRYSLLVVGVVALLPLIYFQRIRLMPRVWLFPLPIVYIMSAAGIQSLFRFAEKGRRSWLRFSTIAASILLFSIGSMSLLQSDAVIRSYDTMPDALQVIHEIQKRLDNNAWVICGGTCQSILQFYVSTGQTTLRLFDRDGHPLESEPVYVVAEGRDTDPEMRLQAFGLDPKAFNPPQLIATLNWSRLFLFEPIESP